MIDIVLATYNGERYLAEQIESIQKNNLYQEKVSRLIIVDDGSTDNTQSIVESLAIHDDKIEWSVNTSTLHGPSNNFAFGLSLTTAPYNMLSDQDDIWLPEKIEISLRELQLLEKNTPDSPCLVFSDKYIVDENLASICDSYFTLKNIPHDWYMNINQLCQQNVASGCTMLFNRTLLSIALPIPKKAYMHDWWLVLVASRFGMVKLIEQPLIKYRQHENNSIGAKKISKWNLLSSFNTHLASFELSFSKTIAQAKAFRELEVKHNVIGNKSINALANISSISKVERIKLFFNNKITRSHIYGRLALLIVLLKMKVEPS